jgi:hypothetical protein
MTINPYQPPASEPRDTCKPSKPKRTYSLRIITGQVVRMMAAMSFFMLLGSLVMDEPTGVGMFGCLTGFFVVLSASTISR